MNFAIFIECLWRFNTFIGETAGRRALLLLDNASVHGREEDLPDFPNVQVKFLPKRTTSILQPLDLGIIACFKRRFQQKQAHRAVYLIEEGICEGIYRVDMKLAIQWVYNIWFRTHNRIVLNCWLKSGIIQSSLLSQ